MKVSWIKVSLNVVFILW